MSNIKIAIIQTGCWGDNINSTLMLKPIKTKYKECTIDVYTTHQYGSAFKNNPYIHKIYLFHSKTKNEALHLATMIKPKEDYDIIINAHPLFNPDKRSSIKHPEWGVNIVYSWVRALEDNDIEYEIPLETILQLTDEEIENVKSYLLSLNLKQSRRILMEIEGESGQSHWNGRWTDKVINHLSRGDNDIFVSCKSWDSSLRKLPNVHFVGHLSIRECAELYNHCDVFLSVSSGLSNACNTNWCKKDIKWIEAVNSMAASSAAVRACGKIYWLNNDVDGYIECLRSNGIK